MPKPFYRDSIYPDTSRTHKKYIPHFFLVLNSQEHSLETNRYHEKRSKFPRLQCINGKLAPLVIFNNKINL